MWTSIHKMYLLWDAICANKSVKEASFYLQIPQSTVYRWLAGIREKGLREFIFDHKNSKKRRRKKKYDSNVVRMILKIRKEYRNCCVEKIQYILKQRFDFLISLSYLYVIS